MTLTCFLYCKQKICTIHLYKNRMSTIQKIDYLKQDEAIPGQKFALLSMIEPKNSKLLKNKESFYATHFIQKFIKEYLFALEYKNKNPDKLTPEIEEKLDDSYENIQKLYYEFQKHDEDSLETEWQNKYNTNDEIIITGIKIRGVYPNDLVLTDEIKRFHKHEPAVDIYVAPIGKWVPYCPINTSKITNQYAEEKLNAIMKERNDVMEKNNELFEKRLQDVKESTSESKSN